MPTPATPDARWRLETPGAADRRLATIALARSAEGLAEACEGELEADDRARARRFHSESRRREYIVSRWLLVQAGAAAEAASVQSLSHCRRWLAAAVSDRGRLGVDVECRLPRHLDAVVERLGWEQVAAEGRLQAWTLWEAWRKLEGGSVLDAPDATYARALTQAAACFDAPVEVDGTWWWSLALDGAVLSLAARP